MQTLRKHSREINSVAFSPDDKLIASGSWDDTIKIWNTATTALQLILEGHSHGVSSVNFSFNGELLASGSYDKIIKLWDTMTGDLLQTLEGHYCSFI